MEFENENKQNKNKKTNNGQQVYIQASQEMCLQPSSSQNLPVLSATPNKTTQYRHFLSRQTFQYVHISHLHRNIAKLACHIIINRALYHHT